MHNEPCKLLPKNQILHASTHAIHRERCIKTMKGGPIHEATSILK